MNLRLIPAVALTIALSACATSPSYNGPPQGNYENSYSTRCESCGRVERIEQIYGQRHSSGAGAVIGGIVGGVLGNQVGKGDGRKAATVVGVVAGAAVGNEVEKDNNGATTFDIYVHMDDGRRLIINQRDPAGIREGSYVSIEGGRARLIR